MEIAGKIYKIGDVETVGQNSFQFRNFVIEEYGPNSQQYQQYIPFRISGSHLNLIDNFKVGDEIQVTYDLRGRLWKNPQGEEKAIFNLEAWRIMPFNGQIPVPQGGMPQQHPMQGQGTYPGAQYAQQQPPMQPPMQGQGTYAGQNYAQQQMPQPQPMQVQGTYAGQNYQAPVPPAAPSNQAVPARPPMDIQMPSDGAEAVSTDDLPF